MSSPSLTESAGSASPTRYWSPRPWKATCPPGCAVQTGTGSWWRAGRLPVDERDGPPARAAATGPAGRGRDEEKRRAGLAREALARAKADARAHGLRPAGLAAPARRSGSEVAGTGADRGQAGTGADRGGAGVSRGQAGSGADQSRDGTAAGAAAVAESPAGQAGAHSAGRASRVGSQVQAGPRAGVSESGRRTRRRAPLDDPQPLRAAIDGLLDDQGWREPVAIGSVFGRWAEIVGPDLAAHSAPDHVTEGELTVTADSTAWATQLRLLAPQLLHRINAELRAGQAAVGAGPIRRVRVRGPAGPARRPGEWRVRGS